MSTKIADGNRSAFSVDDYPMVHIAAIHRNYNAMLANEFMPLGVTPQHWRILVLLQEKDGYSSRHLSEITLIEQSHFSRIIDSMEAQGLVLREAQTRDKRVKRICITQKGRDLFSELLPLVSDLYERAFVGFNQEELADLLGYLRRLRSNIVAGR